MRRRAFLAPASPAPAGPAACAAPASAPRRRRPRFEAWAADFIAARDPRRGSRPRCVRREFAGLTLDPQVVALDSQQPEFSRPISDYVTGVASDDARRPWAGADGRRAVA